MVNIKYPNGANIAPFYSFIVINVTIVMVMVMVMAMVIIITIIIIIIIIIVVVVVVVVIVIILHDSLTITRSLGLTLPHLHKAPFTHVTIVLGPGVVALAGSLSVALAARDRTFGP